jgi:hypothetical protein
MPEHLNVCIRVRPLLSDREEADGSSIIVHDDGKTVDVEGARAYNFGEHY